MRYKISSRLAKLIGICIFIYFASYGISFYEINKLQARFPSICTVLQKRKLELTSDQIRNKVLCDFKKLSFYVPWKILKKRDNIDMVYIMYKNHIDLSFFHIKKENVTQLFISKDEVYFRSLLEITPRKIHFYSFFLKLPEMINQLYSKAALCVYSPSAIFRIESANNLIIYQLGNSSDKNIEFYFFKNKKYIGSMSIESNQYPLKQSELDIILATLKIKSLEKSEK